MGFFVEENSEICSTSRFPSLVLHDVLLQIKSNTWAFLDPEHGICEEIYNTTSLLGLYTLFILTF